MVSAIADISRIAHDASAVGDDRDWRAAPIPRDIRDRRIEITGPTDRKMVINALNCGANVYMADFEDATTPSWDNLIEGQVNLIDAVHQRITFDDPETGRHYALHDKTAVLFVRPRGWHLPEKHVLVDGEPMLGALFDFGLFFIPQRQGADGARHWTIRSGSIAAAGITSTASSRNSPRTPLASCRTGRKSQ